MPRRELPSWLKLSRMVLILSGDRGIDIEIDVDIDIDIDIDIDMDDRGGIIV